MLMQRKMPLHTNAAEEHYKALLQIPDFMQKTPLKLLAAYLGIIAISIDDQVDEVVSRTFYHRSHQRCAIIDAWCVLLLTLDNSCAIAPVK